MMFETFEKETEVLKAFLQVTLGLRSQLLDDHHNGGECRAVERKTLDEALRIGIEQVGIT